MRGRPGGSRRSRSPRPAGCARGPAENRHVELAPLDVLLDEGAPPAAADPLQRSRERGAVRAERVVVDPEAAGPRPPLDEEGKPVRRVAGVRPGSAANPAGRRDADRRDDALARPCRGRAEVARRTGRAVQGMPRERGRPRRLSSLALSPPRSWQRLSTLQSGLGRGEARQGLRAHCATRGKGSGLQRGRRAPRSRGSAS